MAHFSLTPSQFHIWKSQAMSPNKPLFNQIMTVELSGESLTEADSVTMQKAWLAVQQSYPVLGTTLQLSGNGLPEQGFGAARSEMEIVQLSYSSESEEDILNQWISVRGAQPFDLNVCLSDAALLNLDTGKTFVYLNIHHMIVDAWSIALLIQSLLERFSLIRSGCSPEAKDENSRFKLEFSDYAHELVDFSKPHNNSSLEQADASLKQSLALPTFYQHTNLNASSRSTRKHVPLSDSEIAALSALSQEPNLRQFNVQLYQMCIHTTVLAIYLRKVTEDQSIIIEAPISGRFDNKWKPVIGNFIEMIRLELTITGEESTLEVYQHVRARLFDALRNAGPGCTRDLKPSNVHGVINFITSPESHESLQNHTIRWHHSQHSDMNHPLRLHIADWNNSGGVQPEIDLNEAFYPRNQLDNVRSHLHKVYRSILASRTAKINSIAMAAPDELWQLTNSHHKLNHNPLISLAQRFDSNCASTPNGLAICDEDVNLNYLQVQQHSRHVEQFLKAQGIGKGHRVAIIARRSIQVPIALLGILRAGATYVPIDHKQPANRISAIVREAQVQCAITDPKFDTSKLAQVCTYSLAQILPSLQDQASTDEICSKVPKGNMGSATPATIEANDPAYMIFTSGSTGTPKGVVVSHGSLMSYLDWANVYYRLQDPIVMPFHTSIGFDLTLTSLFLPWLSGGTVRVFSENIIADSLAILDVIRDPYVNTVKLTPSHLSLMVDDVCPGESICQLIVGGEDLTDSTARMTAALFKQKVRIINEYGPTEATVGCIVHNWQQDSTELSVPIGLPISGMSAYVLNELRQPQFEGVPGELYLSGRSLAQGYWSNPSQTADCFIANPWLPGEKMYRTGDLVRIKNKRLNYLGRKDTQVKVNGHRIELSEIESIVSSHPHVAECVVIQDNLTIKETTTDNTSRTDQTELHCRFCGLSSRHPQAMLDSNGICSLCTSYASNEKRIQGYFRKSEDLVQLVKTIKTSRRGDYDALVLLSGGKDSTYSIAKLIDMGLKVYAFSLDNGYISDQAKANIDTVCASLGIKHHYASTKHMDAIFSDSLRRHSNVCNGCFKTIYTLSLKFAAELNIDYIFTGLSRGQLFETRLNNELFSDHTLPIERIDEMVQAARIQYHAIPDASHTLLNVESVNDGTTPSKIAIVDFYRYHHVELSDMIHYLETRVGWIRPADTGRSTNCLINDVGIHIHKIEQGFHNYSLPYSWDVRLGHKTRKDALEELNDDIDTARVESILNEINYKASSLNNRLNRLLAFVTSNSPLDSSQIDSWLESQLPDYMRPSSIVLLESMPLTANGKVDRQAISQNTHIQTHSTAPLTSNEIIVANVWKTYIASALSSSDDNFFKLGGDSLSAIRCTLELRSMGYAIEPADLFRAPILKDFSALLKPATEKSSPPVHAKPDHFSSISEGQRDKLKQLLSRKNPPSNN